MANYEGTRERMAEWQSKVKAFRVEDQMRPLAPLVSSGLVIGIIFEFVVIPHECTRVHPGKAGKIFGRQLHFLPLRRNAFTIGPTDRLFERDLLNL
jgi:hypothetical protein